MVSDVTHFLHIAWGVDVDGIVAELDAHHELWNAITARKKSPSSPHLEASDIWVRYNDIAPFQSGERPWSEFNDMHVPVWYPAWDALPSLKPIVFELMARVQGEMIGCILITKIPPGGKVLRHIDFGWHVETFEKFYLQLKNAPGSKFWCEHRGDVEANEPKPGDIWLFDNRKLHWVENNSTEDRITCVICIKTDKFGRKPLEEI
jgi:hypothetical protein